jgi:hypothetical protein
MVEGSLSHPTHRFRNFKQPLNNAVIIHYMLYLKNLKLFEALYEAEGKNLVRVIDSIRKAVVKGGEPFEAVQSLLSNALVPGGRVQSSRRGGSDPAFAQDRL